MASIDNCYIKASKDSFQAYLLELEKLQSFTKDETKDKKLGLFLDTLKSYPDY